MYFRPQTPAEKAANLKYWVVDQFGRLTDSPLAYALAQDEAERYAKNLPHSDVEIVVAR